MPPTTTAAIAMPPASAASTQKKEAAPVGQQEAVHDSDKRPAGRRSAGAGTPPTLPIISDVTNWTKNQVDYRFWGVAIGCNRLNVSVT